MEWMEWWMEHNYPGLLGEYMDEGALVFDIGANIGKMTTAYLEQGARVVAVEPQSVCVNEELLPRFGNDERVTIVHAACGERVGQIVITTYGHGSTISTIVPDHYWRQGGPWANTPHDGSETVALTTLDALIEEYGEPSFIKIDVEGYEHQVLLGLSQFVPLSFEFHPCFVEQAKDCLTRIESIEPNVEFNHTFGESLEYASPDWFNADEMGKVIDSLWVLHGTDYFGNVYARKAQA